MITDNQILQSLLYWKKENRFKTIQLQQKLGLKKATFHRRVASGGWTHEEVELMKLMGIIKKSKSIQRNGK